MEVGSLQFMDLKNDYDTHWDVRSTCMYPLYKDKREMEHHSSKRWIRNQLSVDY